MNDMTDQPTTEQKVRTLFATRSALNELGDQERKLRRELLDELPDGHHDFGGMVVKIARRTSLSSNSEKIARTVDLGDIDEEYVQTSVRHSISKKTYDDLPVSTQTILIDSGCVDLSTTRALSLHRVKAQ